MKPTAAPPSLSDLVLRYARLLDRGHYDEWLELFAENGSYSVIPRENRDRGARLFVLNDSKAQLQRRIAQFRDTYHMKTIHMVTNVEVEPDGGEAGRVTSYFTLYRDGVLVFVGQYEFDVAQHGTGWRIRRCQVVLDTELVRIIQMPI